MNDLRGTLRRALASRFGIKRALDDDTELFSSGLIDSLSVIDLVCLVETETGQSIPPAEITLENFDSVNRIAQFVEALASVGTGK